MSVAPRSPDIFELLDVEDRENSYSRLLAHLLGSSEDLLRKFLVPAFGTDAPDVANAKVVCQHRFKDGRIVDIFVHDEGSPPKWAFFIENKLFSGEHDGQTADYLAATRALVGPGGRAGGIFLTITGHRAKAEVPALTHSKVAEWITQEVSSFPASEAIQLAADAYARRASAEPPAPPPDSAHVLEFLAQPNWGLVPHLANVSALGLTLLHGISGAWEHDAVRIQSRGHANPGLQFWQDGWRGRQVADNAWTPENIFVHLEIELEPSRPWRLKVHFETEPYLTQTMLPSLAGHAGFATMRDTFRAALHARHANFPHWKLTRHKLQSAVLVAKLDPDVTVAQLRASFGPAMAAIAPCITHALAHAHSAMRSSPARSA